MALISRPQPVGCGRSDVFAGYVIQRLVAHAYEVVLDGVAVGRLELVLRVPKRASHWRVVLEPDFDLTSMPPPFTQIEHTFRTFAAAIVWLDAKW